ncbi:MAG TPA: HAD family hydrolase [Candidatus Saccharimonadales bacterium]|nr:HAD family hydrolase [Candidatus Saccharimonadales bacterium]
MNKTSRLAVFDVDGTIADKGVVPASVLEGIKNLRSKGYITTVSTGRGYVPLKEMLGDAFKDIISSDALLILEHGTKIVNFEGEVIFGEFFNQRELAHIVDFTRANIDLYKLAWFNPTDVSQKVQVWCINQEDIDEEIKKRGHYANVFHTSIGEFEDILLEQHVTNVTLKLKDYVKVENLKLAFTRTDTNVIFQDGNMEFVKSNINKGLAVEYVAKQLNVDSENILVAGNAINDIEMLDIDSGLTLLVSIEPVRSDILSYLSNRERVVNVDSPHELGEYLKTKIS